MSKRKQKNFFLTLLLLISFWSIQIFIIFFIEPEMLRDIPIPGSYFLFFFTLFFALFFTFALIFTNSRTGFLISLGITIFLFLRVYKLGNILNLILIIGIVSVLEIYFRRKS